MFFRKKSKAAAAPAPAGCPLAADGEADMRGLGRALWQKQDQHPWLHDHRRRRGLRRRQRHHPALPLRIAPAAGSARERVPARRSRQEQRRAHHHRSGGGDQPDPARAVARSGAQGDPRRKPRRQSGIRSARASPLQGVLSLFGIGRDPQHDVAGRAHAGILLRPAQCLCGREVARDRRRFLLRQSELAARVANRVAETYLEMQQTAKQDQTRAAGTWLAGEIDKMRTKVADAEAKVEQYRVQDQSVRRLQQYLAAEPAAHRDQLADRGGARTEGRSGGEGAPIARSDPLRQVDRFLRYRQFRHDAPPDRAAHRAALAARRAIDHAA